jgi:hypothetical protein
MENKPMNSNKEMSVKPRPLGELLDAISAILRRYVVFPLQEQANVVALWVVHTWLIDAFEYTPYLNVFAAAKRSGKSRVLEVLELLCRNPELTQSGSSAALIRSIDEAKPPTFLLDEVDAIFGKKNDAEAENTRRFLNAGFKRGAKFLRCVGQGATLEAKKFPAFCAKALAGIGRALPDTVLDRSLPIELERQPREKKAERFREREVRPVVEPIRAELEALAQQPGLIDTLRASRPMLPEQLNDRAQDICEPLLAIADLAGGRRAEKTRAALIKLYGQEEDEDKSVKLLVAIKDIFDETGEDKITTRQLLDALVAIEDGSWATMFEDLLKHEKYQTAGSRLTKLLKDYRKPDGDRLKPHKIRVGDETLQGFYRTDFERAWGRNLPNPAIVSNPSGTNGTLERDPSFTMEKACSTSDEADWNTSGTEVFPHENAECSTVPAVPPTIEKVASTLPKSPFPDMSDEEWAEYEARFNAGKTVYPGDWIRLHPDEEFPQWRSSWEQAVCNGCEVCGESLRAEPYLWFHRTRHVARCPNCQETEWWADGYQIDEYGYPSCWSYRHNREQRIAERNLAMLERATQRWKESAEGKTLLEAARLECHRLGVRELITA